MDDPERRFDRYAPHLVSIARRLQRDATVPERLLWSRLRARRLGVRFLRQRSIAAYVVDFFCLRRASSLKWTGETTTAAAARTVLGRP